MASHSNSAFIAAGIAAVAVTIGAILLFTKAEEEEKKASSAPSSPAKKKELLAASRPKSLETPVKLTSHQPSTLEKASPSIQKRGLSPRAAQRGEKKIRVEGAEDSNGEDNGTPRGISLSSFEKRLEAGEDSLWDSADLSDKKLYIEQPLESPLRGGKRERKKSEKIHHHRDKDKRRSVSRRQGTEQLLNVESVVAAGLSRHSMDTRSLQEKEKVQKKVADAFEKQGSKSTSPKKKTETSPSKTVPSATARALSPSRKEGEEKAAAVESKPSSPKKEAFAGEPQSPSKATVKLDQSHLAKKGTNTGVDVAVGGKKKEGLDTTEGHKTTGEQMAEGAKKQEAKAQLRAKTSLSKKGQQDPERENGAEPSVSLDAQGVPGVSNVIDVDVTALWSDRVATEEAVPLSSSTSSSPVAGQAQPSQSTERLSVEDVDASVTASSAAHPQEQQMASSHPLSMLNEADLGLPAHNDLPWHAAEDAMAETAVEEVAERSAPEEEQIQPKGNALSAEAPTTIMTANGEQKSESHSAISPSETHSEMSESVSVPDANREDDMEANNDDGASAHSEKHKRRRKKRGSTSATPSLEREENKLTNISEVIKAKAEQKQAKKSGKSSPTSTLVVKKELEKASAQGRRASKTHK